MANSSKSIDWIIFLVTAVITIVMVMYVSEWFWVVLPFPLTYFAKALDAI